VSELRSRAKPATAEHALWTAVSQALGIANEDLDRMAPGAWAEAYRLMDRIDRTTAMDELRRLCPEDFP
jgi:predicted component of type VI protein secretion system